jgi:hypothetical protein
MTRGDLPIPPICLRSTAAARRDQACLIEIGPPPALEKKEAAGEGGLDLREIYSPQAGPLNKERTSSARLDRMSSTAPRGNWHPARRRQI